MSPSDYLNESKETFPKKNEFSFGFLLIYSYLCHQLINNDFHDEETYCSCSVDATVAPDGNNGLEPESISDGPAEG